MATKKEASKNAERDAAIVGAFKAGAATRELSDKHGLSSVRINRILQEHGAREVKEATKPKVAKTRKRKASR